ncbi:hypothetical protein HNR44_003183 [Geomicrobium halophilum]|uniref:Uncharacterized protein n=1 Tax=Geomicrobium halophilum TaxID=549000 RepID=A0A841PR04_9BACL|nr:hypothetical protein [Geomicrobium halophilum]MBB6451189.1 hypothetical protein [Geomicrobium halophilum]
MEDETEHNRVSKKVFIQHAILIPLFVCVGIFFHSLFRDGDLRSLVEIVSFFIFFSIVSTLFWLVFRKRLVKQEKQRIANKGSGRNLKNNVLYFGIMILILFVLWGIISF